MGNSVEHNEPTGDVVITISETDDVFTAKLVNGNYTQIYSATGGTITIPAEDFTDAIANHASLLLRRGLDDFGGSITFLPEQESEVYESGLRLRSSGVAEVAANSFTTDFVDVSLVREMVVSGGYNGGGFCVLFGYDENKEPVRVLLPNTAVESAHVIPDNTYKFVRASSSSLYERSLMVYYRNRG